MLALASAVAPLALSSMGPAEAQTAVCTYPFTDCPTTTLPNRTIHLFLNLHFVLAGQPIHILACGVENGTIVKFTFAGILMTTEVGRDTPPRTCTQSDVALPPRVTSRPGGVLAAIVPSHLLGGSHVRAQVAQTPYVETTFLAPSLAPGTYPICAIAAGYDAACADVQIVPNAQVLGEQISRADPANPSSGVVPNSTGGSVQALRNTNNGSPLARTGLAILKLVLLAALLIGLGWVVVRRSRRLGRR